MRRFSWQRMSDAAGQTVRRFPLVLLSAVVAGTAACFMVGKSHPPTTLTHVLMSAQLGIPLLLAVTLAGERAPGWGLPSLTRPASLVVAVLALVLYGLGLSGRPLESDWQRFVHLNVGLHLLVAVLPFVRGGEVRGFWQFNVGLLVRFITGAFFSAVLFAGLALALVALETLLGVDIDDDLFLQLWCLIAFVFNTAYLLGGVPGDLAALDRDDVQPRVMRVFAQFILAPLVIVYLAILLAYLVKVVAATEWPSGWIGYLVSGVALAGLLSLLLLKLEAEKESNRWVTIYARLFHWLMVPPVVMLALAVIKRVQQYGITEPRFYLMVLTAWLAVIVVVGCARRTLMLRAIPASLCVVVFVVVVGPWSAYSMSRHSQLGRLETLLADNQRLDGGVIATSEAAMPGAASYEFEEILRYLFNNHGVGALGSLAGPELQAALDEVDGEGYTRVFELVSVTAEAAGIDALTVVPAKRRGLHDYRRHHEPEGPLVATDLHGYTHLVRLQHLHEDSLAFDLDGEPHMLAVRWNEQRIDVSRSDLLVARFDLAMALTGLRDHGTHRGREAAPDSLLMLNSSDGELPARLLFDHISWNEDVAGVPQGGWFTAELLLGRL